MQFYAFLVCLSKNHVPDHLNMRFPKVLISLTIAILKDGNIFSVPIRVLNVCLYRVFKMEVVIFNHRLQDLNFEEVS